MYCKNCGKMLGDGAAFCDNCGARQVAARPATPQPAMPQPAMPQPIQVSKTAGKGLKIVFFCALAAAVAAFAVFAYFQWLAPEPAAQAFAWDEEMYVEGDAVFNENYNPAANPGEVYGISSQASPDAQMILGLWEADMEGIYIAFEFLADGTVYYYEDDYEYVYAYAIDDGLMTIMEDGGIVSEVPYSFAGSDTLLLLMDGETLSLTRTAVSTQASTEAQQILGLWETEIDGMRIAFEFYADGSVCYYEDDYEYVYAYTTDGGFITIMEDGEIIIEASYSFSGSDTLVLMMDGESLSFTRAAASTQTSTEAQQLLGLWETEIDGVYIAFEFYSDGFRHLLRRRLRICLRIYHRRRIHHDYGRRRDCYRGIVQLCRLGYAAADDGGRIAVVYRAQLHPDRLRMQDNTLRYWINITAPRFPRKMGRLSFAAVLYKKAIPDSILRP